MVQMYEVFIGEKKIILSTGYDIESGKDHFIYLQYDDFEELHFVLELLQHSEELHTVVIQHEDLESLFNDFRAHFTEIDAAGGVVINPEKEVLLIHRRGKWDLPKGKLDPGESPREAAVREVSEECGIPPPEIDDFLLHTYHVYDEDGKRILKRTHWYAMYAPKAELTPQAEEDILKAEWVPLKTLDTVGLDTYANIRIALNAALRRGVY